MITATKTRVYHVLATDPAEACKLVAPDEVLTVLEGHCKIVWPEPTPIDKVNGP